MKNRMRLLRDGTGGTSFRLCAPNRREVLECGDAVKSRPNRDFGSCVARGLSATTTAGTSKPKAAIPQAPPPHSKTWRAIPVGLLLALGFSLAAPAAEFDVPSADYPTIQDAVNAAAAGAAAENFIHLQAERIDLHGEITIVGGFDAAHSLVIRPDPGIGALRRVTLANDNGFQPIVRIDSAGAVTLQDLDLIRHTTNHRNLLEIWHGANVVVERCRVGSDWPVAGDQGYANIYIEDAQLVIVRNTFCFAYAPGTLDAGIRMDTPTAMNNSVFLYNNTVADHRLFGIDIKSRGDSVLVLRNSVVVNRLGLEPEPFAYRADVELLVQVISSHNTAFASPVNVELIVLNPGESIIGTEEFLLQPRAAAADAFLETLWIVDPPWHPNPNFHRLRHGGPLHNLETDAGVNVRNNDPDEMDFAVPDDWEKDPRYTGDPPRTDRGADQFHVFITGDIGVFRPRIPVFTGSSFGLIDTDEVEVIAVGPQDDIPDIPAEAMSGGEFSVSGAFVSIGTPQLVGFYELRLVPSPALGGNDLVIAWPKTVRAVSVQAATDLAAPGSWTTLPVQPVTDGDTMRVTVPITGPQRFFRLRY